MRGKHNAIRIKYDVYYFEKRLFAEHGLELPGDYVRKFRDEIKRLERTCVDPLEKPLTEAFRTLYDEEGGYKEYGILPEDGTPTTDDEIREYIEDNIKLPPIYSPFDCTGRHFTRWVDYKRTPAGIAIIHSVGMDI